MQSRQGPMAYRKNQLRGTRLDGRARGVDECKVAVPHLEEAIDQTFQSLATAAIQDDLARLRNVEDGAARLKLAYMASRVVGRQSETVDRATDSVRNDFFLNMVLWLLGWNSPDNFVLSLPESTAPLAALAKDAGAPGMDSIADDGSYASIPLDAFADRARSRLAELRQQRLHDCRREEIFGGYDPNNPGFLELASVSSWVTGWVHSIRDFVFVRYRCPSAVGVFVFSRYRDDRWVKHENSPPTYRFPVLTWRFLTDEQWARLRTQLDAAEAEAKVP
jgi:hypothetical protein